MQLSKITILLATLMSFGVCLSASADSEIKKVVIDYHRALQTGDRNELEKVTGNEYFKELTQNKLLERYSKVAKKEELPHEKNINIKKSKIAQGLILAGIKKPGDDHKLEEWYKIEKQNGKFKITEKLDMD